MNEFETGKNNIIDNSIDPMIIDDEEVSAAKKKTWELIYLLCPEQAEILIKEYDEKGPEVLSKAKVTIAYPDTSETPA